MRRWLILLVTMLAVGTVPQAIWADEVSGSSGAGWQSFPSTVDESGTPYWAGNSWDPGQVNIGFYLTCTGGFASNPRGCPGYSPSEIQGWGMSSGAADANFTFTVGAGGPIELRLEIAGFAPHNEFGWYEVGSGTMHTLFTGPDGGGVSTAFNPGEAYGFYLIDPNGNTYYTESWRNPAGEENHQHFAVFLVTLASGEQIFYIGVEDLPLGGDEDYNDMIVKFSPVSVPEPSTFGLLGVGLAAIGFLRRRRAKSPRGAMRLG